MTEEKGIEEQKLVAVTIYGVPEEDWIYFKEIIKVFEGDRVRAFRAILDSYNREQLTGEILTKIGTLERRIEDLEQVRNKEGIKTFGGL